MARILIVEDNESLRSLMRLLLNRNGYEVVEAPDGAQALALLARDATFEAIISDIRMPNLDGIQFTETVRQTYPSIPVIIASAYFFQIQEALRKGAARHLVKPFSNRQLLEALQAVLACRSAGSLMA